MVQKGQKYVVYFSNNYYNLIEIIWFEALMVEVNPFLNLPIL